MKKEPYLIPEAVCIMMLTAGRTLVEASGSGFEDVEEDDWNNN
jgi:hypothetical protein